MPNYLVVATSGRAIAQGLKSLGHSVFVVDGFADSDARAAATDSIKVSRSSFGLSRNEVCAAVVSLQSKTAFDGLFYDAALESDPALLDNINIQPVYGNVGKVLEACKNPSVFFSKLDEHSIPYPEIDFQSDAKIKHYDAWLIKHAHSSGGIGVRKLDDETIHTKNSYYQKKVEGLNFSITFLANGEEIFAIGFNTQWSEPLNEPMPYAYAGAINSLKMDGAHKQTALQYVTEISKAFGLVGLNSIDFILADQQIYVLEVNPRIPATYELYETKNGALLQEHMQACAHGILPDTSRPHLLRAHAIVYAPHEISVPSNMSWPLWSADRPCDQELIKLHEPVCSIFAGGQNSAQVCEMIKTRKRTILAKLVHG